jgi:hypothetical protein
VRAVGGRPDTTPGLGQLVGRLGQPLYLQSAPTGYPEREESWVSTNALLERFNVAVALAAGRLPGVTYDVGALLPPGEDRAALVAAVCEVILHGGAGPATVETLRREVEREASPVTARALALGLALGSPEFQRQ